MIRATQVLTAGEWSGTAADRVILDHDQRHRRRMAITGASGLKFLLDLGAAMPIRHGDGLQLEDGRVIEVIAAPEPLAEIAAGSPPELARIAWHLGNRHLPAEIGADRILIRDDHVIVDMLKGLGAQVRAVKAPFDPEGGAYGQQNHDHSHPHGHVHDQRHG